MGGSTIAKRIDGKGDLAGPLYAHSWPDKGTEYWEPLSDHLEAVGMAAKRKATAFEAGALGEIAGKLHDLGKAKPAFQAKLHGELTNATHSGEGARLACKKFGQQGLGKLMAYCIAGHHAGLANGRVRPDKGRPATPLSDRLKEAEDFDLPDWLSLPDLEMPGPLGGLSRDSNYANFALQFFTRMLFSTLVDADFIETERFYHSNKPRGCNVSLEELQKALALHLATFGPPKNLVNRLRAEVLDAAAQCATQEPGLFSMTVPTGGGKTLSSLRFALDHALAHGLRRVIYVAPFTAIIEQTADVFRKALDHDDAVLEHHSSFVMDAKVDEDQAERMRLATQNWDRPVIVTTAVQFFESLFANRTQKCRKLHNIARSVIILDEAQTLPVNFLRPCLAAIKELARGYGCSVVMCTATQPAIYKEDGLQVCEAPLKEETREITTDPNRLHVQLKRVDVQQVGLISNLELAERVRGLRALVIVNNKRQARKIFDLLRDDGAYHLSTSMTARHRREVLEEVKLATVPLISTALVEAGVDLDFPQVWRAVAGIDSIAQAAGRCNREGKLKDRGQVFVFEPEEGFPAPPELQQSAEVARSVLKEHADPLHLDTITAYFQMLYWDRLDDLDAKRIINQINGAGSQFDFPFADIAADFRIIKEETRPLIIGGGKYGLDDDARKSLVYSPYAGSIARKMQHFSVSVSPRDRKALLQCGAAHIEREVDFKDQFVVLDNLRLYDDAAGFLMEEPSDLGPQII